MSGRREQRAELESTWQVWDARRPIRAEDMAEPPPPEAAPPAAEASPAPHGGAICIPPDDWTAIDGIVRGVR